MTLNRILAPELKLAEKASILQPDEIKLDNGLSIYVINSGEENVVKFEIIFPTGNTNGKAYINALACHQLADSGTLSRQALEIAAEFDYFGSFFQSDAGPDHKSFSLYSLGSLFDDSLKIVNEILTSASFPETEISNWKKRNIQAHSVNMEKVSWMAKKSFNETLFGNTNAYGYTPDTGDYDAVNRDALTTIFKNNYNTEDAIIILSGKITQKIIDSVNKNFGQTILKTELRDVTQGIVPENPKPVKIRIAKEDSVQSAIRIGRQLFSKNHPDFLPLLIANTLLGGYFGSRLMSNIREDKGYTYGIGSGLHSYLKSGSFFIATEVGKDVCDAAINEIYIEIQKLISEPAPEKELILVKNYLSGAFQRSINGPFELAERFKGLRLHGLEYDYFDKYLHLLNKITAEEVMQISAKHLQPSSMTEVFAG